MIKFPIVIVRAKYCVKLFILKISIFQNINAEVFSLLHIVLITPEYILASWAYRASPVRSNIYLLDINPFGHCRKLNMPDLGLWKSLSSIYSNIYNYVD